MLYIHTILIGLYHDDCTQRTLCYSNCSYCALICGVRMEGGNCQSSAGCCKLSQRVCDQISHIDLISSDSPVLVPGR